MLFISFRRRRGKQERPTSKRPKKEVAAEEMKRADAELNKIAEETMRSWPGVQRLIRETTDLGMRLMDANLENIKSLTPQQKGIYGEWAEHRIRWFTVLKEVGKHAGPLVQQKIDSEITKLNGILKKLRA